MTASYPSGGAVESGLIRVLAPNPSPMTQDGTNSFVLGHSDVAVIDPGPDHAGHHAALLAAVAGRPVRAILVSHSHLDHAPGATALARATGAPIMAFGPSDAGRTPAMAALSDIGGGEGVDHDFTPDRLLADGDRIAGDGWTLACHWTPGHMANHLSFEWPETRMVFTGDTVMGWASTMISPPDGDLGQFMASLDLLEGLDARVFHCGHGGPVTAPAARCRELRAHRHARTEAFLTALPAHPTIPALVSHVYADTPRALHGAAARNVLAHLLYLIERGEVAAEPGAAMDARYTRL